MLLGSVAVRTEKPQFEVADVFREYGAAYRRAYPLTEEQSKALWAIANCRTAALGGFVEQCDACAKLRISYCSCKRRDCPKCGAWEKALWLAKLERKLLPIPYFHVVFTTDHRINGLARIDPWRVYNLLFRTAAETLKAYGRKYLGGEIGFTMVLHTWGQTMEEHIHVHCIVTGGAWRATVEGGEWRSCRAGFLFPVKALSRDFRDAFCAGLKALYPTGTAPAGVDGGRIEDVDVGQLVTQMRSKRWEVFIKPAPSDPRPLCDYLGKYTQKSAISNYRIVGIADGKVSFTYYDNQDGGEKKVLTLDAFEFMRRFLQHVLPAGFHRVRHYGLHHPSKAGRLAEIRAQLGAAEQAEAPKLELHEWLEQVTGEDSAGKGGCSCGPSSGRCGG